MYDGGLDGTCWFCSALKGLSSWRRAYAHSLDLVREERERVSARERERERERMNGSESARERSRGEEEGEEEEEGLMHAGE